MDLRIKGESMDIKNEIIEAINGMKDDAFVQLKQYLTRYLFFYTFNSLQDVDKQAFEEKLCDYFEMVKIENKEKTFPLSYYVNELFPMINVKNDKKLNRVVIRKYVDKASALKKIIVSDKCTFDDIRDFSRIFLCVYEPYMKKGKAFEDRHFSFDFKKINFKYIFDSLQKEKKAKELHSKISFSTVILVLMYFDLLNSFEEVY